MPNLGMVRGCAPYAKFRDVGGMCSLRPLQSVTAMEVPIQSLYR